MYLFSLRHHHCHHQANPHVPTTQVKKLLSHLPPFNMKNFKHTAK